MTAAQCGAYYYGPPEPGDDYPGPICTRPAGHSGQHVDHDNSYGPIIWDQDE